MEMKDDQDTTIEACGLRKAAERTDSLVKPPTVSMILPVYNCENFVRETIKSVLEQTFLSFELIVINDGSTDLTENVVLSFKDDRIIYKHQKNQGIGVALSFGCSLARGKYIARIDGDDVCLPTRLEKQVDFLERNRNVVLLGSAVYYIDCRGRRYSRSFPYPTNKSISNMFRVGSVIAHPTVMMRASEYRKTKGYLNLQPLEDLVLWRQLAQLGEIRNLMCPLVEYRVLEGSISRSISRPQYLELIRESARLPSLDFNEEALQKFRKKYNQYKMEFANSGLKLARTKKQNWFQVITLKICDNLLFENIFGCMKILKAHFVSLSLKKNEHEKHETIFSDP